MSKLSTKMLDTVRQRLNSLQSQTSKQKNLWKPTPGETTIRLLPYKFNPDNFPFVELYFHWQLAGKNYVSPISFGKPDPIVEFSDKLKSTGNKEEWKLGKKLEPKLRVFAPVLVRGEEKQGIKFWGFGKEVYQELLTFIQDPEWGEIWDIENGYDIKVKFQTAEEVGKNYPKTTVRLSKNSTPAFTSDLIEVIKETQSKITDVYKLSSYDELKEVLNNWLDKSDDDESSTEIPIPESTEDTNGTEKSEIFSSKSSVKSKTTKPITKTEDVAKAFDSLFKKP